MTNKDEWVKQGEGDQNIWLPTEKGTELVGSVKDVIEGKFGSQLVVVQEDNVEITTPSHKVLQNRIKNVKKDDMIKIVYTGEELPEVKGNNPTRMYDVYIKGGDKE